MNYLEHFERRRDVCGGELVVKGTRVTARTLLASLSEAAGQEEILADFPTGDGVRTEYFHGTSRRRNSPFLVETTAAWT
jgi:hypothetical protein